MAYSPRQVVVRAREAAAETLRAIERGQLVAAFLDDYAREYGRAAKTAHLARYHELLEVIGREALLAMVLRLEKTVPPKLGIRQTPRKRRPPSSEQEELLELFWKEFFVSLGEGLEWEQEEFQEFCRDLDLYRRVVPRAPAPRASKKLAAAVGGPFVDRVGLLLDPSLFEKARRAASKFHLQLEAATDRLLRNVFSSRRKN
jgi:hypothetical protein